MSSVALVAQQDGYWNGWSSIVGATFAYQAISDVDDATYIIVPRLVLPAGRASFPVLLMADGQIPVSVQVTARARQDAGGSGQTIQVGFSRGGAFASDGVNETMTGSATNFVHNYATSPFSGSAWKESDLDGLELAVSRGANVGNTRLITLSGILTFTAHTGWRGRQARNAQLR